MSDVFELSAPYLQLLDIDEAMNGGLPMEDYLEQLEEYLWGHFDSLEHDFSDAARLMKEGLLRMACAAQSLAEGEDWLELASRANRLLLEGVRSLGR